MRSFRGFLVEKGFRIQDGSIAGKVDMPLLIVAVCGQGKSPICQFYYDAIQHRTVVEVFEKRIPPGKGLFTQSGTNGAGLRNWLATNRSRLMLVLEEFFYLVAKSKNDPDAKKKLTLNEAIKLFNPVANSGGVLLLVLLSTHPFGCASIPDIVSIALMIYTLSLAWLFMYSDESSHSTGLCVD
jgi:hypothetical protein